jgi:hypothetical protein
VGLINQKLILAAAIDRDSLVVNQAIFLAGSDGLKERDIVNGRAMEDGKYNDVLYY